VRYANGEGVAKDETAAYMWYLLAGAKGNENARKNIPKIEESLTSEQRAEGQRMAKDWKPKKALGQVDEAREWLAKALEIGGKELNLRALDDEELAAVW
jgi:TPR repeat protein